MQRQHRALDIPRMFKAWCHKNFLHKLSRRINSSTVDDHTIGQTFANLFFLTQYCPGQSKLNAAVIDSAKTSWALSWIESSKVYIYTCGCLYISGQHSSGVAVCTSLNHTLCNRNLNLKLPWLTTKWYFCTIGRRWQKSCVENKQYSFVFDLKKNFVVNFESTFMQRLHST